MVAVYLRVHYTKQFQFPLRLPFENDLSLMQANDNAGKAFSKQSCLHTSLTCIESIRHLSGDLEQKPGTYRTPSEFTKFTEFIETIRDHSQTIGP